MMTEERFKYLTNEQATMPEGYSAPVDTRTTQEIRAWVHPLVQAAYENIPPSEMPDLAGLPDHERDRIRDVMSRLESARRFRVAMIDRAHEQIKEALAEGKTDRAENINREITRRVEVYDGQIEYLDLQLPPHTVWNPKGYLEMIPRERS